MVMDQRMESEISGCSEQELQVCVHHVQRSACHSRAKYREGRRPKAVRVYTINLESRYLLVQGVPAIGVTKELVDHFALFGTIEEYHTLDEYPAEEFTEVYLIKFQRLQTARVAKRKLDERSFFGGVLHVCYAPEFESVQETREKLQDRRRFIARVTSDKDYLVSRIQGPKSAIPKDIGPHYQHDTSVFIDSEACTSNGNRYQQQFYQSVTPPSQPASTNLTVSSSRDHIQKKLHLSSSISDLMKTNISFSDQTLWLQGVQPGTQSITTHSHIQQRANPSDNGINRFMPRTTQLQERKRKRDQSDFCSLFGKGSDEETIIGPKLPEIPKVDMEDDSLNISANTIRSKLKKVSLMPIAAPEQKQKEDIPVNPAMKPRRRI